MKIKKTASLCVAALWVVAACAAPVAWVAQRHAEEALRVLKTQTQIRYSTPLLEGSAPTEVLSDIAIRHEGGDQWSVHLNGRGVDLARVYVQEGARWVNLGLRLGLDISGAQETLE